MKAVGVGVVVALTLAASAQAFPGRNGVIAFTRLQYAPGAQGPLASSIYSVSAQTRVVRRLASPPPGMFDSQPAWAPDGTRLAFVRRHNDRAELELLVMNARGRTLASLLTVFALRDLGAPAWSPDGSEVAVVHGGNLLILDAETGARRSLRIGPRFREVAWSPDGRFLATIASRRFPENPDWFLPALHVMPVDGEPQALHEVAGFGLDWSPDGRRIVFPTGGTTITDPSLWTIQPDGSDLTSVALSGWNPSWSPDGRTIAFDRRHAKYRPHGLFLVSASSQRPRRIVAPPRNAEVEDPAWQPRCTRYGGWRADTVRGTNGFDLLCGLGGNDTVIGGRGSDRLFGEEGNDRFLARDGEFDVIGCGPGWDTVAADQQDLVGRDCEVAQRG
jgi:dipeptidyl aminopeptidase/acylaminoacyl peptidase